MRRYACMFLILLACLAFSGCASAVQPTEEEALDALTDAAADAASDGTTVDGVTYTYEEQPDGMVALTGYSGGTGILRLPGELDDKTVTKIGDGMFEEDDDVQKVVVPASITAIGERAFAGADSLYEVMFLGSLDTVGKMAFYGCPNLQALNFCNGVSVIGSQAMDHCASLWDVYLPAEGVSFSDTPICLGGVDTVLHVPAGSATEQTLFDLQAGTGFTGVILPE